MKKLLLIILMLWCAVSYGQKPNYSYYPTRGNFIAVMGDSALHMAIGCGKPLAYNAYATKIWPHGAAFFTDTCNSKLYLYRNHTWVLIPDSAYVASSGGRFGVSGEDDLNTSGSRVMQMNRTSFRIDTLSTWTLRSYEDADQITYLQQINQSLNKHLFSVTRPNAFSKVDIGTDDPDNAYVILQANRTGQSLGIPSIILESADSSFSITGNSANFLIDSTLSTSHFKIGSLKTAPSLTNMQVILRDSVTGYLYRSDNLTSDLTLMVNGKGSGKQIFYVNNDSLNLKDIGDGLFTTVTTGTDSTNRVNVDTSNTDFQEWVASFGGRLSYDSTYGNGVDSIWVDTTISRLVYKHRGFIYRVAITDSISATPPDEDALAYIAAEETACSCDIEADDEEAINDLIVALKAGDNAWGQIELLYLFFGTGLVNAKNPGTFDAIASGSPTIDANGVTFNGTSNYLRTQLVPSSDLSADSESFAVYVKTGTDDKTVFGSVSAGVGGTYFLTRSSGSTLTRLQSADIAGSANASNPGLYVGARRGSAPAVRLTKDGTQILSTGATNTGRSVYEFYIGAFNNDNAAALYNASTLGCFMIGNTLTDTQMGEVYTAMAAFITATGRN